MEEFNNELYDARKKYWTHQFQKLLFQVNDESPEDNDAFFNAAEDVLGDY